jgi:hypothetical protein
LGLNEFKAAVP